jgi:cellobiose transport system substrate-binding protein
MTPIRRGRLAAAAGIAATCLVLTAACGGPTGAPAPAASETSSGPVTLTVATFNEFGYEKLFAEYEQAHPEITITHKKAATSNEARDNLNTRLAAGSGLADIEAIEVDWVPELMPSAEEFVDLSDPAVADRWLDWKVQAVTTEDGQLLGYGTDIGPEAICYRGDLFEKAGLPSDREEVATLLGTTWESYFAAGRKFAAKSDVPWFDGAQSIAQGMINQVQNAYESDDGTVIAATNPEVRATYDAVLKAGVTDDLSAKLVQWTPDWTKSFQNDGFATMLCPGWMLGVIAGNADGVKGWDVANVFPGGGGNWGGSYLTVPKQSAHPDQAKALANWLTAPEQQLKAFAAKGTFPSQKEALSSPELAGKTDPFFNNAPTGKILVERANAVTVSPFKGENYFAINDAFGRALVRVESGKNSPEESWKTFLDDVSALG